MIEHFGEESFQAHMQLTVTATKRIQTKTYRNNPKTNRRCLIKKKRGTTHKHIKPKPKPIGHI